ncbi:MAG: HAD family hydrolase [Paludibacteraceae bacterium]|nr:HAD family hydrolase [Paludibacteraceae bacterium]MBR6077290.1 HAD family hydrolase [Paludibacteraceae bacterium]
MSKKLVIFDLDGTLLDTIADLAAATNYALRTLGYPQHDVEAYKMFVGNGIGMLFHRALPEDARVPGVEARMRELFLSYYKDHSTDLTKPYPGIVELLGALKSRGIMTAVASNKYHEGTCRVIRNSFPDFAFNAVYGHREGYNVKPDPAIVFDILSDCGIRDKSQALYVGDTSIDMNTARNAGLDSVAVLWGFRSKAELEACSPSHMVTSPSEILDIALK